MRWVTSLRRTVRGRLVILALAAVVATGAMIVAVRLQALPTPTPTERPAVVAPAQPLIVSVAAVRNADGRVFAGLPVTVSAHALSETGVAALELWDGARLVAVHETDPASSSPAAYARWQWTPAEMGLHTLFVRGVDLRGGVVQSNAVRVRVTGAPVPSTGSLTGELVSLASVGSPPRSATRSASVRYGIDAPNVQATLNGCELQLKVSDVPATATGIQVVGLAPAGSSFTPLMTLPAAASKQAHIINLGGGGTFLFAASVFDTTVLAYSPPVEVTAPSECETAGWSGTVTLVGGKLQVSQSVDKAYLYLTRGDGAAVRVPAAQGTFVEPDASGSLDFGPVLPPLGGSPLSIEAWGWKGGSLVKLGSGSFTPAPSPTGAGGGSGAAGSAGAAVSTFGSALDQVAGTLTTLRVVNTVVSNAYAGGACVGSEIALCEELSTAATIERPANGSTTPLIKKFRWTTVLANVDQFVWQILPYPPAKTADLNPPFMVDQGVIAVPLGQSEGEFSLDFNKYFLHSTPTLNLKLGPSQSSAGQLHLLAKLAGAATPAPTPTAGNGGTVSTFAFAAVEGTAALAGFSDKFYVRLVPIQFNSAASPSNPVVLDVVEPAAPIKINQPVGDGWNQNAYTVKWTFEPPVGPDPAYSRCAIVTSVDWKAAGFAAPLYDQYRKLGTVLCYKPPGDDDWDPWDVFEAFVEFVSDVWDYVSDGIAWIKNKVVDAVLMAVPCAQIASEAVCKSIATAALDAALISVGVPPTLPNFDTVVAGLKADLTTFIVESAGSIPGVAEACGLAEAGNVVSSKVQTCEELAGAAIDAIVAQVKEARSDAAGQASGYAWPGVTFEPDPRGIWHPPTFTVTVTRTNDPVLPKTCSLWAWMESTKKGWKFPELWYGYPKDVTADVSGRPLASAAIVIPPLAPGESITRTLWLSQPTKWFESLRSEWYWKYLKALNTDLIENSRAWVLLTAGSELTFGVESNCAKPSKQGPVVLAKGAYDTN